MSSYTKKTYIVFLDLPEKTCAEIDRIRQKYATNNINKCKAHLTLKQDEDYLSSQEEIKNIVSEFAGNMESVTLEFGDIKIHEQSGYNIYLGLKDNSVLIENIKLLSQKMEGIVDSNSPRALMSTKWEQSNEFYLHISLKGATDADKARELLKAIKSEKMNLEPRVICKTITLANWCEGHWRAVATYELSNQ